MSKITEEKREKEKSNVHIKEVFFQKKEKRKIGRNIKKKKKTEAHFEIYLKTLHFWKYFA